MATNGKQDDKFLREVILDNLSSGLLDDVLLWIRENLEPECVFGKDDLCEWARCNTNVVEVCHVSDLHDWAEENGYVKADEK